MPLQNKIITNKSFQQNNKSIPVIHPERPIEIATAKGKTAIDRESLVSWLFLIGSLLFLGDGLLELTEGISIHVVIHIAASILFTIGSILFIPVLSTK